MYQESIERNAHALGDVFLQDIYGIPGGDKIKECIQCGTCSASCPTSYAMDYTPREIIAAFRAGMLEKVLKSNTIWLCSSCYSCTVRCPSGIKLTDIMYELKRLAIEFGLTPKGAKAPVVAKLFVDIVNKNGRIAEVPLVSRFMLKTNLLGAFKMIPRAAKMSKRGRMPITSHKIEGIAELEKCTGAMTEPMISGLHPGSAREERS
ncbi:MAG: 4Fe-4S dicluster domain-containing protein [Candidatus Bathyarchaeia archaeon]